ncbi:MAG: hypothetical protein ABSD74_08135 [Rhizomicrobium sp.]|jgi:hypothetical protein
MAGVWSSFGLAPRAASAKPSTWKVIQVESPFLPKEMKKAFGVIVSSDAMLAHTHTAMFCLLVPGLGADDKPLALEPWHVDVGFDVRGHQEPPDLRSPRLSTKLIFPAQPNEIDKDGKEHGYLSANSIKHARAKLGAWMPFKAIKL